VAGPFFEKNLDALKSLNLEQAKTIEALSPKVEERLFAIKPVGEKYANIYYPSDGISTFALFSSDKPEKEIQNWLFSTGIASGCPPVLLLLGFDLGFYPTKLLDYLPETSIAAIVEPDPILFFTAIHHTDLSRLLSDKRVHLYVGQKAANAVESIGTELKWGRFLNLSYKILVNPLLRKCQKSFATEFTTQFRNALQRERMYRNSRMEHGANVVINTVHNADFLIESPGVTCLWDQFQKIPAILVAAGPSLEKTVDQIRKAEDRALIVCVNTAYPILRRHGITPHIVITMDHQERNVLSFHQENTNTQSFLIADPRINPQITAHFMPRVFFASWRSTLEKIGDPAPLHNIPVAKMSGNAIYQWLQEMTGPKGDVFGPGSVTVVGFHILARMGCEPIILAGQDLAFSQDKAYADGTIFDDKSLPQDSQASHMVESTDGTMIPTSETLFLYRQLLETEIARFKVPVFNTSSGAVITGTISSTIESLLPQFIPFDTPPYDYLCQLHQANPSRIIYRDLQHKLREGIHYLDQFATTARASLAHIPETPSSLPVEQKKALLKDLKTCIATCTSEHLQALNLLNELLQETHFEFERSQWTLQFQKDENQLLDEEIHISTRVLDAFVRQASILASLFEEKIEALY
jgi:hypothetical protein